MNENSTVSQIQLAFIKYHNSIVDKLKTQSLKSWNVQDYLFKSARNEACLAYQKLIIEDFLPRIVFSEVLKDLKGIYPKTRKNKYLLYTEF